MNNSRPTFRPLVVGLSLIFLFSFLTMEIYANSACPWLRLPGFMESDMEFAPSGSRPVVAQTNGVTGYCLTPHPAIVTGQTELFLNIYRAPPL
jgi:hypothetical protein